MAIPGSSAPEMAMTQGETVPPKRSRHLLPLCPAETTSATHRRSPALFVGDGLQNDPRPESTVGEDRYVIDP
jgi:hypothetical protein